MQLSLQHQHEDVSSDGRQTSDKQLRLNLYSGVGVCDGAPPPQPGTQQCIQPRSLLQGRQLRLRGGEGAAAHLSSLGRLLQDMLEGTVAPWPRPSEGELL